MNNVYSYLLLILKKTKLKESLDLERKRNENQFSQASQQHQRNLDQAVFALSRKLEDSAKESVKQLEECRKLLNSKIETAIQDEANARKQGEKAINVGMENIKNIVLEALN